MLMLLQASFTMERLKDIYIACRAYCGCISRQVNNTD